MMVMFSNGLFFSGTMHIPRKNKSGKLFCFDKNKSISIVSEGTMVSNGLAWNKSVIKCIGQIVEIILFIHD